MKVNFFWDKLWQKSNRLDPVVNLSDCQDDSFKGLITSFLTDDEGHGIKFLANWINEGLIEVE